MTKLAQTVLICGIVRNCEHNIVFNVNHALQTGKLFQDYRVIVYENNSTDNTKYLLQQFQHDKLIVKCEDIDLTNQRDFVLWAYTEITGGNQPCRVELISNARNKVLEIVNQREFDEFTHVIWIDMDSHGWALAGVEHTFSIDQSTWDVVFANNPRYYYDLYAYRSKEQWMGPEIIGDLFWNQLPSLHFPEDQGLIPVLSAFGGLGIYKKQLFRKHRFAFQVTESVKKMYVSLYSECAKELNSTLVHIIHHPDEKFPGGEIDRESGIFFKANSGYNGAVVCEHVGLNFDLVLHGYKLFINPKMLYYYGN